MTPQDLTRAVQSMLQTLQAGRVADAQAQAEAILRAAPGEPNASQVVALVHLQQGEAAEALPHLQAAARAAPDHPPILNMLGVAHKRLDRPDEARAAFERAIAADGQFIDAWLNLAQLDLDAGDAGKAAERFDRALSLDPGNAAALAGRARAALLAHENETARECAGRALAQAPGHELAGLTLAEARLRLTDFEGAFKAAAALAAREDIGAVNRTYAAGFAADALDRLGRYDEAFPYYQQANDLQADAFAEFKDLTASPFSPEVLGRVRRHLDAHGLPAPPPCGEREPMPVFLVGFPRSGTTLLEQVLMAHPGIESFGEHAALMLAAGHFYTDDKGFAALGELDEEGAAACRAAYWKEIAKLGPLADGQILLDKLPLNSVFLPVIARVFPRARILFALRDPRDVVLSCFQQRFGMNAAMYQLLRLDSAARYYDQVMGLAVRARELHEFALHEVRYENVIADLEGEARAALAFLDLEWDDRVLSYREGARARAIDTPSVAQVVEPLYTRAKGKWRNYATQMAPVLERLAPWTAHWGYTD